MEEQYLHSYTTLGLQPGAEWHDIRGAYKSLINKWHPDRFQQDADHYALAEERTMEITRAYNILVDYYRMHGSTPALPRPVTQVNPSASAYHATTVSPAAADAEPSYQSRASATATTGSQRWRGIALVAGIVWLLVYWSQNQPTDVDHTPATTPLVTPQVASHSTTEAPPAVHSPEHFFTRGSKLGEVYAIQGIPTETVNGVWHYGKSRVYFVNGSVSHWENHPDNPLHAKLDAGPVPTAKNMIQRGSTKDEVRAIQGTPWIQTERIWSYGSSRIFFSDSVVTGWEESPLHPLKVQK